MKKRGFTLVELLAVIAIIAILTIIVLPNILEIFNDSKKNTFLIEVKSIFNSADMNYAKRSLKESDGTIFYRLKGDENVIVMNGRNDIYYYVKITNQMSITQILVWDSNYTLKCEDENGINISDLSKDDFVNDIDTSNLTLENIKLLFD